MSGASLSTHPRISTTTHRTNHWQWSTTLFMFYCIYILTLHMSYVITSTAIIISEYRHWEITQTIIARYGSNSILLIKFVRFTLSTYTEHIEWTFHHITKMMWTTKIIIESYVSTRQKLSFSIKNNRNSPSQYHFPGNKFY